MFDAETEKEVAELCKSLWQRGVRTLGWSNPPTSKENPWAEGWVDVYIEDLCDPLGMNWLATIVHPADDGEEGYGYLKEAHDARLVFEFEGSLAATKKTFVSSDGARLEIEIDSDSENKETEGNEFYWSLYRREDFRDPDAEIPTYLVPVWSAECISRVVSDWLFEISGRRFLLYLDDGVESPMDAEVRRAAEEIASGNAPIFDLGDGLSASESAFDALLSDPELAAEITAALKKNLPLSEEDET